MANQDNTLNDPHLPFFVAAEQLDGFLALLDNCNDRGLEWLQPFQLRCMLAPVAENIRTGLDVLERDGGPLRPADGAVTN